MLPQTSMAASRPRPRRSRAGAAPLDELVLELRARSGIEPPRYPGGARFAVALTHDIDTPWRWTRAGLRGAAARGKEALASRRPRAAAREAAGLALAAVHRLRGSDPNWSHATFGAMRARARLPLDLLRARRPPRPARRRRAGGLRRAPRAARARAARAGRRGRAARELHAACEDPGLLAGRARRAAAPCAASRSRATASTTCACAGTRRSARSTSSGSTTTRRSAGRGRPGPRAGLSFPFRPWTPRPSGPLRIVECPLLLMDATLAEERYLGLSRREEAWAEVERVLDHLERRRRRARDPVAQRPLRSRLRTRLGPPLRARARRHRGARRHRLATAGIWRRTGGTAMRLLIVSFYFPPAGGGGVQRVLSCASTCRAGIEVTCSRPTTRSGVPATPGSRRRIPPAARCTAPVTAGRRSSRRRPRAWPQPRARAGARRLRGSLLGRRLLLPDPEVVWLPDAVRAALRIVREREIDAVLTTSPPASAHLIGAAVARRTGVPWVADLRDSLAREPAPPLRAPHACAPSARSRSASPGAALARVGAVTAVTPFIADEAAALAPRHARRGRSPTAATSSDVRGARSHARARACASSTRARSSVSARRGRSARRSRALLDARPDLRGRIEARFLGELRPADPSLGGRARARRCAPARGFRPHAEALAAMKGADVLLLLVPRAGGRGLSVLSGQGLRVPGRRAPVLALVPPEGAAADARARHGRRRGSPIPTTCPRSPPRLGRRRRATGRPGGLEAPVLSPDGASGSTGARGRRSSRACCSAC